MLNFELGFTSQIENVKLKKDRYAKVCAFRKMVILEVTLYNFSIHN